MATSEAPESTHSPTAATEIEPDIEPVPRRRLMSLPDNFSGTRHYHVHEHHYHVWDQGGHGGYPSHKWTPRGRPPWQMRQWNGGCPSCSSGAWAPPWVFGGFPYARKARRFSLAGGVIFLVLMALCRGGRALMHHFRPSPPALE